MCQFINATYQLSFMKLNSQQLGIGQIVNRRPLQLNNKQIYKKGQLIPTQQIDSYHQPNQEVEYQQCERDETRKKDIRFKKLLIILIIIIILFGLWTYFKEIIKSQPLQQQIEIQKQIQQIKKKQNLNNYYLDKEIKKQIERFDNKVTKLQKQTDKYQQIKQQLQQVRYKIKFNQQIMIQKKVQAQLQQKQQGRPQKEINQNKKKIKKKISEKQDKEKRQWLNQKQSRELKKLIASIKEQQKQKNIQQNQEKQYQQRKNKYQQQQQKTQLVKEGENQKVGIIKQKQKLVKQQEQQQNPQQKNLKQKQQQKQLSNEKNKKQGETIKQMQKQQKRQVQNQKIQKNNQQQQQKTQLVKEGENQKVGIIKQKQKLVKQQEQQQNPQQKNLKQKQQQKQLSNEKNKKQGETIKQMQKQQKRQVQNQKIQKNNQQQQQKTHLSKEGENKYQNALVQQQLFNDSRNIKVFQCQQLEHVYHYYDITLDTQYYRSKYQLFFQVCSRGQPNLNGVINRQAIQSWSKKREVYQWAMKNVNQSDQLLYDNQNAINFQEIVILSRLIGSNGKLFLFNTLNSFQCWGKVKQFHQLNNINYVQRENSAYKNYPIVITKNQGMFSKQVNNNLFDNPPSKIFIQLNDMKVLSKVKESKAVTIMKANLNSSDCKDIIKMEQPDYKPGFYQIIRKDYKPKIRSNTALKDVPQNSVIKNLKKQFEEYKRKLPSPSEKKDITKILRNFPIQSKQLTSVTEEQTKEWETEQQIVEWVRNRTKLNSTIFYQHNPSKINLLVVLNIAALAPDGTVFLQCSAQSWEQVRSNAQKLSLKNIKKVQNVVNQTILASQLIVTDNLETIAIVATEENIKKRLLLGYFDEDVKKNKQLLYKLYVNFHIRKVSIVPSYYFGYEVFDHFFWHSEHPKGFFQIQQKTYVLFQIWSQSISQLTNNRHFNLQQNIRINTVEIKIINPSLLKYFILPQFPLHKAYQHLTPIHRGDYLRFYLLHYYGGGYADIKHIHYDFFPYFKKLAESPADKYAIGTPERESTMPTCIQQQGLTPCYQIKARYWQMMGGCVFIFKKGNPITAHYLAKLKTILDTKYQALKSNPYSRPYEALGWTIQIDGRPVLSTYPLRWEEVNAEIFTRAYHAYIGHYYLDLPRVNFNDYR